MNIFYTSSCPEQCAKYLDDKRVVKMTLETAQILSTAVRYKLPENHESVEGLYKSTHHHHPCVLWAGESQANFSWTLAHLEALLREYSNRYPGKSHACTEIFHKLFQYIDLFPEKRFANPPNCTRNQAQGIDFTGVVDTEEAYVQYLAARWEADKRTPTWYGEGR